MKAINLKISLLSRFGLMLISCLGFAQQGHVDVFQDEKINTLMRLKKEINLNETDPERYKIQVFSGNRSAAQNAEETFTSLFTTWKATMHYETPNFKIWVGNFRSRLEADRALKRIRKEFSTAFVFRPKNKK